MSEHQSDGTHGPDGVYVPSTETAERDAEMARMRSQGKSYRAIATHFGVSVSTAHEGVDRALKAIRAEAGEAAREMELRRLDAMVERIEETLTRRHIVISHGHVVRRRVLNEDGGFIEIDRTEDGEPIYAEDEVEDDEVVLKAIDRLLKISQRRAALLGLDAPTKVEQSGTVKYELVGVPDEDM